ncbi:MAG: prepilin-type N-terminal cleavage/methylation domain-containing protein [Candidatus Riflebacteria bacterium]|nr:prepilin-type N-terminal cleavage/methylation domain-containing protein [Candidatus Riflebacteria bacterium]
MGRPRRPGFSLVEILVAVALLALALAPMIPRFIEVRRQSIDARNWVVATSLAAGKLGELEAMASFSLPLAAENREINGMAFEIVPTATLVDPVPGFEKARPPVIGWRLEVRVLWHLPGTPDKKHDIGLRSFRMRPRPL